MEQEASRLRLGVVWRAVTESQKPDLPHPIYTHLLIYTLYVIRVGFPDSSVGGESACNEGDPGFLGRPGFLGWEDLLKKG